MGVVPKAELTISTIPADRKYNPNTNTPYLAINFFISILKNYKL